MNNRKLRLLVLCGTLETGLHPVPPVADGAPEWNVFRLSEIAAFNPESRLEIHVISPCESWQWDALQEYPVRAQNKYHHIVFSRFQLDLYRKVLRHVLPLRILVRQIAKLPDLLSYWYLLQVRSICEDLQPDLIIINDRPQYIPFVRRFITKGRLFLMLRYPMGESRRFLKLLDGILINSNGMRTYVEQLIQVDMPPIWQIPNTLGDDFFVPNLAANRFFGSERIVLFAGRLIREKGVLELLLAFQKVHKVVPNSRLMICGSAGTYSSYEQELSQIASQFPAEAVKFLGYITNRQMKEFYLQANVAVFPSLPEIYVESFGMVALEAMRCGVPVVASHQPGFEELVLPGTTGLLVDDPRDTESLAQAIIRILQNPPLAQQLGDAGYKHSLNYTPQNGLWALERILQNYPI